MPDFPEATLRELSNEESTAFPRQTVVDIFQFDFFADVSKQMLKSGKNGRQGEGLLESQVHRLMYI